MDAIDEAVAELRDTFDREWQRFFPSGKLPDSLASEIYLLSKRFREEVARARKQQRTEDEHNGSII